MQEKKIYLEQILESIEKIESYVQDKTIQEFETNSMMHDACLMQFQHIGEIANKIRTKWKIAEDLPYSEMIGFRNYIAHEYLGIDIIDVWDTIQIDLPELRKNIKKLL
jgi:uncharacterized protein with HEPN domain